VAIDYWELAKDYQVGDLVQKFMPGRSEVSPYAGRVIAVLRGIGFLDVQWPFGAERVSPEEVVRVNPAYVRFLPPTLNTGYYPGYDAAPPAKTATGAAVWRTVEVPQGFHRELAALYHKGMRPVQAYDALWHRFRQADDEAMRDEVSKFYRAAYNTVTLILSAEAQRKTAAYWAATDRKYRATKQELDSKRLACPKCKDVHLRKTTYKMEGGQRMRLLACPQCLHLVKQTDVLGPEGEPVGW
jgi:hypothetical protein